MKEIQKKGNDKKEKNKNGEGSFRQKGNKWEGRISVTINGRSVQKSVSGDTEREVKDKAKLLQKFYQEKEEKYRYLRIKQSEITVDEWIKIWVKDYKRLTIADTTLSGYISKINSYIRPYLGHLKIQMVTKNDVQLFANHLATCIGKQSKKPLSIKTIKDTIKITRMIFADAEEEMELIPFNPVKKPKLPKRPTPKKREIVSITEQLQIINILLSEYNGIAYFTLFTLGVRASELAGFLWKDLDDILNGIHVERGFQRIDIYDDNLEKLRSEKKYTELKSETSDRIVPIIPLLREALLKYKMEVMRVLEIKDEKLLDNESMFKTKNGNQLTADYLRHRLQYVLKKYGFTKKVTTHELRHTFATRCLEAGMDMKTLQTLLGHADYTLTANTYSHVLRQTQNNQILKYNTYIADTIQNSLDEVIKLTEQTVKDPKLREKAIENLKKNFGSLVDEKIKEQEKIENIKNKPKRYIMKKKKKVTRRIIKKVAC